MHLFREPTVPIMTTWLLFYAMNLFHTLCAILPCTGIPLNEILCVGLESNKILNVIYMYPGHLLFWQVAENCNNLILSDRKCVLPLSWRDRKYVRNFSEKLARYVLCRPCWDYFFIKFVIASRICRKWQGPLLVMGLI